MTHTMITDGTSRYTKLTNLTAPGTEEGEIWKSSDGTQSGTMGGIGRIRLEQQEQWDANGEIIGRRGFP